MSDLEPWERYQVSVVNLGPENGYEWLAEIPQLDGCRAYGDTKEQALRALEQVAREFVRILAEAGEALPPPVYRAPGAHSGRFVVRVSPTLHKSLAQRARQEGVSLNHLCSELLAQGIGFRSQPKH